MDDQGSGSLVPSPELHHPSADPTTTSEKLQELSEIQDDATPLESAKGHTLVKCYLLDLPAELRTMIFEYTAIQETPIELPLRSKYGICSIPSIEKCNVQPALALTCRQARMEVLPIYYSKNIFRFCIRPCTTEFVASNIRSFGAAPEHIKIMKCIDIEHCRCRCFFRIDLRERGMPNVAEYAYEYCNYSHDTYNSRGVRGIIGIYRDKAMFTEAVVRRLLRHT